MVRAEEESEVMETVVTVMSLVIIVPASILILVGIIYGIMEIIDEVKKRREKDNDRNA